MTEAEWFEWAKAVGPWVVAVVGIAFGVWKGIRTLVVTVASWIRPHIVRLVTAHSELVENLSKAVITHEEAAKEQTAVSKVNSETLITQTQLLAAVAGTVKDHDDKVDNRVGLIDKRIDQILDAVKGSCKAGMSAEDSVIIPSQPKPKK